MRTAGIFRLLVLFALTQQTDPAPRECLETAKSGMTVVVVCEHLTEGCSTVNTAQLTTPGPPEFAAFYIQADIAYCNQNSASANRQVR